VPHLATIHFSPDQKAKLRRFKAPVPVREISLVTYRHLVKKGLLQVLEKEILQAVKHHLLPAGENDVIAVS
jgi:LysR family hydrogen peroxide-inducible transcriptional activator